MQPKKLVENNLLYDAKKILDNLTKQCPYDYRAWWEMAKIKYKYDDDHEWYDKYNDYYMKAKALCNADELELINSFVKEEQERIFKQGEDIINFCEKPDLSKLDNIYHNHCYKMQYEDDNLALYCYEYDPIFGSGYKKIFLSYLTSIKYEIRKGKLVGIITFEYDTRSMSDLHSIYIIGVTDNKILIEDELTGQKAISNLNAKRRIGCYIATCVYGSYDCPQVWTLRRYRDDTLSETWYGRMFIKCYYAISPLLVKWFGKTKWFRSFCKTKLDKMVSDLNRKGVNDTYYNDKY